MINPQDYRPVYDNSVGEYLLDPSRQGGFSAEPRPIGAAWCLMPFSANVLACLFAGSSIGPAKVFYGPPLVQAKNSPFAKAFTKDVPWLRWIVKGQTVERNAAQIAGYWGGPGQDFMPGDSGHTLALSLAIIDVQTEVEGL